MGERTTRGEKESRTRILDGHASCLYCSCLHCTLGFLTLVRPVSVGVSPGCHAHLFERHVSKTVLFA